MENLNKEKKALDKKKNDQDKIFENLSKDKDFARKVEKYIYFFFKKKEKIKKREKEICIYHIY